MKNFRKHLKEIEEAICQLIYYSKFFITQIRKEFSIILFLTFAKKFCPSEESFQRKTNEVLGISL